MVRDFLVRGGKKWGKVNTPLKSVLLFGKKGEGRNKKACEAFRQLPSEAVVAATVPDIATVPTFWLLREAVADGADCKILLDRYDYEAASVLLQIYGRAGQKGPVLLVADSKMGSEQRFAFIDLQKASEAQIQTTLPGWFKQMSSGGLKDVELKGKSIGSVLAQLLCNTGEQVLADYVPTGADPTNPATFGYANGKWTKPSLFKAGLILLGGPFVEAGCSILDATRAT